MLALLAEAATGDRHSTTKQALSILAALRLLDLKGPVPSAYIHEHPRGRPDRVRDLASSLARRPDRDAQVAADSVRATFRVVTPDTIENHSPAAVTAAVDRAGNHWALGAWAAMQTTTLGRQASTRGVVDREGEGHTVTINAGDCTYCQEFGGEAVIGKDPLPPFHPNCSCVVTSQ